VRTPVTPKKAPEPPEQQQQQQWLLLMYIMMPSVQQAEAENKAFVCLASDYTPKVCLHMLCS
jgi:hypothetical protein